jgi:hypothetical protein
MKNQILNSLIIISMILAFELVIVFATSIYWEHQAVVHHGAFFEADSWGGVSFKWNDVSYAQAPFQDPSYYINKEDEMSKKKIQSLGIK